MENLTINQKDIQIKSQVIENADLLKCLFCQLKGLPKVKADGKMHFVSVCDLCQKKLEMLNKYARPF
jgi:hypothetical protein